jgi:hypothetical protein
MDTPLLDGNVSLIYTNAPRLTMGLCPDKPIVS